VVTLDLHKATAQDTMLARDIVRTVTQRDSKIKAAIDKVGDCAFYRPPRGQPQRARMRVTVFPEQLPDREQVEAFAAELRSEYERALNYLDPQGVRRLVRNYLASVHALYLGGPYFVPHAEHAERLVGLLVDLGGGSVCRVAPLLDEPRQREMLTEMLGVGLDDGVNEAMLDAYKPLGVVPDALYQRLKEKNHGSG
jgi:hypothetical protein